MSIFLIHLGPSLIYFIFLLFFANQKNRSITFYKKRFIIFAKNKKKTKKKQKMDQGPKRWIPTIFFF
jgi:hypothetical protein